MNLSESILSPGRVYILPTRSWLVLGAVLLAMWYAAISQSNSIAYLLMFFLASLVLVSAIHAHFALVGLGLRVGRVEPVFAGETVQVPVEVLNPGHRARHALALAPNGRVFKDATHVSVGRLEAADSRPVELPLPTDRRGRFSPRRLALTTVYPLGFFRAWRYEPADVEYFVYPAPAGTLPLPEGRAVTADAVSGSGGGGDDYAGTRAYRPGESQRHVDWRAVARGQQLLVKQFTGTGSRRVWLDLGDLAGLRDTEARLSQLTRWLLDAEAQEIAYGLRLPGFEAEPSRGEAHRHRCLAALAVFGEPGAAGGV